MSVRIQMRRDTSANWTTNNPVLAEAELGFETNTGKFKMGDGVTAWASLPYIVHIDWGQIVGTLTDQTDLSNALNAKSDVGHTHAAQNDPRITTAVLGADVLSTSTTLANVTGLSIALAANSLYTVEANIIFMSAVLNTGIRLTQTIPAAATLVGMTTISAGLTTNAISNQRAADTGTASPSVDITGSPLLARMEYTVRTIATPGNFQVRFASEVNGTQVMVKADSSIMAVKVA